MTQITTADLSTLDPQTAYLMATAAHQLLKQEQDAIVLPLEADADAGRITEDELMVALTALDESGASLEVWNAWSIKQDALSRLMAWGRQELKNAWKKHSRQFPGVSLSELDALFDNLNLTIRNRLIELVLKLDVTK